MVKLYGDTPEGSRQSNLRDKEIHELKRQIDNLLVEAAKMSEEYQNIMNSMRVGEFSHVKFSDIDCEDNTCLFNSASSHTCVNICPIIHITKNGFECKSKMLI